MDKYQLNAFVIQQAIELMKIQNEMKEPMGFAQAVAIIRGELI